MGSLLVTRYSAVYDCDNGHPQPVSEDPPPLHCWWRLGYVIRKSLEVTSSPKTTFTCCATWRYKRIVVEYNIYYISKILSIEKSDHPKELSGSCQGEFIPQQNKARRFLVIRTSISIHVQRTLKPEWKLLVHAVRMHGNTRMGMQVSLHPLPNFLPALSVKKGNFSWVEVIVNHFPIEYLSITQVFFPRNLVLVKVKVPFSSTDQTSSVLMFFMFYFLCSLLYLILMLMSLFFLITFRWTGHKCKWRWGKSSTSLIRFWGSWLTKLVWSQIRHLNLRRIWNDIP